MKRLLVLGVILVASISVAYYYMQPGETSLPIINPIDLEEEMVDPELKRLGFGHRIGDFSFLNQNNETITESDVDGKVYVAEYFFTTCGTICPKMNAQMQRVQFAYAKETDVKILSFTVNPDVDSVEQIKRYAEDHDAIDGQWHFLTGEKEKLYELARKSFFLLKPAEAQNLGDAGSDFIHTNNFVLVDQQKRIRGYYDGTNKEEVTKLIDDVRRLLEEE